MKILYLSNNRFPTEKAHGLQIAKMCEAFAALGADVLLVVPKRRQTAAVGDCSAKEFYGLKKEIAARRIWNLDFLLNSFVPRRFAYFLQSFSFALSFALRRRAYKKYIIYSRTFLPLAGYRGRWFFEAHGFPKSLLGRWAQSFCLKNARGLVCISEALAKKYGAIYKGEILIAHDGVDLDLFRKSKGGKGVLYAGSPYKEKGVLTLAAACEKLGGAECVFVGGNEDEPEFQKLRRAAEKSKVIPYVRHGEIPKYIARAEICVIPNSGKDKMFSEDTSPLKLFEYMACGKKIVASDVPAMRAILNEKTAWFFKPDDAADLRKKILEALKSKEDKGGRAAAAATKYSWKARAKAILAFASA